VRAFFVRVAALLALGPYVGWLTWQEFRRNFAEGYQRGLEKRRKRREEKLAREHQQAQDARAERRRARERRTSEGQWLH
jgi:hypothetical protein